jgi:hypothetical protein
MSWPRVIAGAVVASTAAAWVVCARPLSLGEAELFLRPPAAPATSDEAALLLIKLQPVSSFTIFPKAEAKDLAGAAPMASALRLQGTSSSPRRKAALISVGGATAQWVALGQPVSGIELIELHAGRAVVRTSSGDTVTLELFSSSAPQGTEQGSSNAPS